MNPFLALAVIRPTLPVVRSVTTVVKPLAGSLIETLTTSPELSMSVCLLGWKVCTFAFCGPGGPDGLPFVDRNAKLTGSVQFGFRFTKLNCDSRLSMFSATHHFVALQLTLSRSGGSPGG